MHFVLWVEFPYTLLTVHCTCDKNNTKNKRRKWQRKKNQVAAPKQGVNFTIRSPQPTRRCFVRSQPKFCFDDPFTKPPEKTSEGASGWVQERHFLVNNFLSAHVIKSGAVRHRYDQEVVSHTCRRSLLRCEKSLASVTAALKSTCWVHAGAVKGSVHTPQVHNPSFSEISSKTPLKSFQTHSVSQHCLAIVLLSHFGGRSSARAVSKAIAWQSIKHGSLLWQNLLLLMFNPVKLSTALPGSFWSRNRHLDAIFV